MVITWVLPTSGRAVRGMLSVVRTPVQTGTVMDAGLNLDRLERVPADVHSYAEEPRHKLGHATIHPFRKPLIDRDTARPGKAIR